MIRSRRRRGEPDADDLSERGPPAPFVARHRHRRRSGLLGSAVAAAFAIRRIQGVPTPYDIAVALGFFKLPLGMLTAVAGLLVLGGNFVPGLSELDNQRQILAYALVFGYGQQPVSRFIDARAQDIVKKLPLTQLTPATE